MANTKYQRVASNVAQLANKEKYDFDFIYEFLAAYEIPKSTITRLKSGDTNRVKEIPNAVLQKDVVYFRVFPTGTVLEDEVHKMDDETICGKYRPRYIIASDLKRLVAIDNKKKVLPLAIDLKDVDSTQSVDFFYGWTGDEIDTNGHSESEMDRKAAENINKIYAEIEKTNIDEFTAHPKEFRHSLNVFFTRLLFCLFAEDTGLFKKGQFTEAIKKYTTPDGSDLDEFLEHLFAALDAEDKTPFPDPYDDFPYVDGTIFDTSKHDIIVPRFNGEARHLILECANSDWGSINPDIFGTIFQGVVDPTHRDESGMDYTSVSNILKVINPLFLNELHDEFDKAYDNKTKLWDLLRRMSDIKIFDPACGSGNFLVITYKELRDLENDIWARLLELGAFMRDMKFKSMICLDHFYGIEIDDFAHELAILSMTIAQRQCDMIFEKRFGKEIEMLPLVDVPTIKCGNSARLDWQEVCPNKPHPKKKNNKMSSGFGSAVLTALNFFHDNKEEKHAEELEYDEIYVIGNPPYKGSRKQVDSQKKDIESVCGYKQNYKSLDYISVWFTKASKYIVDTKAEFCFVSTNSITQGEQVAILWDDILQKLEIGFAYSSFKWTNSAKDNAGVTVVIIDVRNISNKPKKIYSDGISENAENISAYLTAGTKSTIVRRRPTALSAVLPKIDYGSFALDGGYLTLSEEDRNKIIDEDSRAPNFIKRFSGSLELMRNQNKYCIWVEDDEKDTALKIDPIRRRIDSVKEWRSNRSGKDSQKNASTPWKFAWNNYRATDAIMFPIVTSERRPYIPIGYLDSNTVISNAALAIYDAEPWLFAILESAMNMVWIKNVCGKLKTDYRYSASLGYNTFPIPILLTEQKNALSKSAIKILQCREKHTEMTLGEMYNPESMPADLKQAHEENDILVDQLYRKKGFVDDEERLSVLFDLYEKMIEEEKINEKAKK